MNRLARNALRQDGTPQLHHARGNGNTRSRLNATDASAQDSDRSVAYVTGSTVRCGIHSARQAADNRCTPLCQCLAQFKCHTLGLIGASAGSNNRGVAAGIHHAEWYSLAKNHQRRVGKLSPRLREIGVVPSHCPTPSNPFRMQLAQPVGKPIIRIGQPRERPFHCPFE